MAEVEGLAELIGFMRGLDVEVKELKSAHKAGATVILDEARPNAPAGPTGLLKKSGRVSGTKTAGVVRFGRGARTPWARPAHFGHANRPQGGFIRPNPFLYDAADDRQQQVYDTYAEFVSRHIDEGL